MPGKKHNFHDGERGAALATRTITNSNENRIEKILADGTIQVQLTASSQKCELNRSLKDFLAKALKLPKKKIDIVFGKEGNEKLVTIMDIDADDLQSIMVSIVS